MSCTETDVVTAKLIDDSDRLIALPTHFPHFYSITENAIYACLGSLCEEYTGGFWDFFELSNGGFYMAPKTDKKFHITCSGNFFDDTVSADAAGIIACLHAYSHLSFQTQDDNIADAFHQLREFADSHAEGQLIFAAID
jgi:hypothetical protein